MGNLPSQANGDSHTAAVAMHHDMLESVHSSREAAQESLKYSYGKSFGGFAAILSPSQVQQLSKMAGVVSVFESKQLQLLTTRSWDFIGFPASAQNYNLPYQSDIIIGVIDTDCFNDAGFGPVPSKWKGGCHTTSAFPTCNKKLVGAKFYRSHHVGPLREFLSPRDGQRHGTQTSSIAAGNHINNVSFYGIAQGNARGGIPGARVAMYKVCWVDGCMEPDILAAFDHAIYDGVDVISVSIGFNRPLNYFADSIAIDSFHAMKRGIFVSNSAGNSGPAKASVTNYSAWSLTVAASTIDRKMESELLLGNNISIKGIAVNANTIEQPWYPIINGSNCDLNALNHIEMKGKIVICDDSSDSSDYTVYLGRGAGLIEITDQFNDIAFVWQNPTTVIPTKQGKVVLSYIDSTT
ncbi:hypothetical protein SUGI_0914420 [Cryptomeria japonica]|nr:hypothetical protein SUGI_0914420 [Cryptomeria japonica]